MPYDKKNPYFATLKDRYLLNKKGSSKKTFHIVLQIDKTALSYKVGDSLAILPKNDKFLVEKTLEILKTDVSYDLEKFLLTKVNICRGTKKLLKLIESRLPESISKKSLQELLLSKDALQNYLNSYHIWEILKQYEVPLLLTDFCSCLQPLLPRFYSIASSPDLFSEEIHLLVAEKTYMLKNKQYFGVGSNYLCRSTSIGEKVGIYIQSTPHFTLPENMDTPIIMIGPGTGLAPFRAFLQQRWARQMKGKNWLFFGERNKQYDFYYQDFFEMLKKNQYLKLDTAFSRDLKKTYVQNLIKEQSAEFWRWINNSASIYVCGDAKNMAKAVEKTILELIQKEGKKSECEAKDFLKTMRREKKYLCDVY